MKNTCTKPNCDCADQERLKRGTQLIKSYPCLAENDANEAIKKVAPTTQIKIFTAGDNRFAEPVNPYEEMLNVYEDGIQKKSRFYAKFNDANPPITYLGNKPDGVYDADELFEEVWQYQGPSKLWHEIDKGKMLDYYNRTPSILTRQALTDKADVKDNNQIVNKMKTQVENPSGLHQKYLIKKIKVVDNPKAGYKSTGIYSKRLIEEPPTMVKIVPVDENAEYFVLRLDISSPEKMPHIKACRIAINAYANAIAESLPELSKDLKEKYPVLSIDTYDPSYYLPGGHPAI